MIKPILHRVMIKPDKIEDADETLRRARAAGIHIELDKREQAAVETGTVVAVGSTCYKEFGTTASDEGIEVGSKVIFAKYAGKQVKDGSDEYIMINDEDVIGVYK